MIKIVPESETTFKGPWTLIWFQDLVIDRIMLFVAYSFASALSRATQRDAAAFWIKLRRHHEHSGCNFFKSNQLRKQTREAAKCSETVSLAFRKMPAARILSRCVPKGDGACVDG